MPRVLQVVVTDNFAGTERYVVNLSMCLAEAGWGVTVVGGQQDRMTTLLSDAVEWLPGGGPREAWASVRRAGRFDVCHAHMTYAEGVAVATRRSHGAPVVSTRHFAARRGSTPAGRIASQWIRQGIATEIAISDFVAAQLERAPDIVLRTGVPQAPMLWNSSSRTVLVLQRLEAEKQSDLALQAWQASGLGDEGWRLRFVGDGSQRAALEKQASALGLGGVEFAGWVHDAAQEFERAAMLLATAPAEPLGLSVIEAMAAGVPVVAAAGGGHLETVGQLEIAAMFTPGDAVAAAAQIRRLAYNADAREQLSSCGRNCQQLRLDLKGHGRDVAAVYRQFATTQA